MNEKKDKTLGMPYGTACNRLRKMILFSLIIEVKKDICFKCKKAITDIKDLTIEHKQIWEGVSADLFWDLDNIAFSHAKCNRSEHQSRGLRKIGEPGTSWCYNCQMFKSNDSFVKKSSRWNGLSGICKPCFNLKRNNRRKQLNNQNPTQ